MEDPAHEQPILLEPSLLNHKPDSQVLLCDASSSELGVSQCVVKIFPPKRKVAYEKELAVYSREREGSESRVGIVPKLLFLESEARGGMKIF